MKPTGTINCSEPTTDALLVALKENILGKSDVRPVINLKTPTNISVSFTLYGILDVVSVFNITGNQMCGSWDKRVSHIRKKSEQRQASEKARWPEIQADFVGLTSWNKMSSISV